MLFARRAGLVAAFVAAVAAVLPARAQIPAASPASLAVPPAPLDLTPEERDWIAQNPSIDVVVVDNRAPYIQRRADGTPSGYVIDMMDLIAQRSGLRWNYQWVATGREALERFRAGTARVTPLAAPSARNAQLGTIPGPFLPAEVVIVTRADVADRSAAQGFAGRRVAIVDGTVPAELLERDVPNAQRAAYPTVLDALRAVSLGEADVAVTWLHEALYHIEANLLANLRVHRDERAARTFLGPGVALREVVLARIMGKALDRISPAERVAVAQRWLPAGTSVLWAPGLAELTPAEREWVQRAGTVRVGYDRDFAPFTRERELGAFEGLGADMLRLAAQKVGLRIIQERGDSFAAVYDAARRGDLDVVAGMARTESRLAAFDFVGPFFSSPTVLVTRIGDAPPWTDLQDIVGTPVGVLREYFLIPQLRSRRPGLQLTEFASQTDLLDALAHRRVGVALGNGTVIQRLIERSYVGRLQVSGVIPDADSELFFGVPRTRPELTRVLAKGFAAITPGEAAELRRRWVFVSVNPGLRWTQVLQWAVPVGLALLLVLATQWYANRRLRLAWRGEADARRDAEAAAQAHRSAEALLHDIASHVPGVVFRYVVGRDGGFEHYYASPGAAEFLGLARVDPTLSILRQVADRVREDHRAACLEAERKSAAEGVAFRVSCPYAHPTRGERWLLAEAVPRRQDDGTTTWTGYVVDASTEHELSVRLAREAESRSLMLASASHELRAPTHTLSVALQSISGAGLAQAEASALAVARQSTRTLAELLNDVLDAARYSSDPVRLRPRSFDLPTLLNEVAGAWRAAAGEKGLGFDLHLAADLPRRVVLDPLRLKQILTNLLSNACKYTPAGRVALDVRRDGPQALRFQVVDTGPGIAPAVQAALFQPYAAGPAGADSPTPPEGSTGLGLSICGRLASMMGGRIEIANAAGGGTVATVVIPIQGARERPSARRGTVLVCDDDPLSRLMMTEMLRRIGFEAEDAPDGVVALERWRRGGIAAVVTDLNMPKLGGRDLIRVIRDVEKREHAAKGPAGGTAIVVCSGSEVVTDRPGMRADAFLMKPVVVEVLAETLSALGVEGN